MTEEKFHEIYHQYYQLVKKVVYNVLRDEGFSEDVCQEVFLAFLDKADTMEAKYYKQWLLVNGKRKAIDFCRKSYQVHETTAVPSQDENGLRIENVPWISDRNGMYKSAEDEVTRRMALNELTGRLFEDLAKKEQHLVRNCYANECGRRKCRRNSPFSWHLYRKSESQETQDKSLDKQILQRTI